MNHAFGLLENKPNQSQFQRQKMLLRLTINGRRKSFGYYADEIEAAKEYDRVAKKYRGEYAFLNFPKK
jgi:hypothetical protein